MRRVDTVLGTFAVVSAGLLNYYIQLRIIEEYGPSVKVQYEYLLGWFSVIYTLTIFALPTTLAVIVAQQGAYPKNIILPIILYYALVCIPLAILLPSTYDRVLIYCVGLVFFVLSAYNDIRTAVWSSLGSFLTPRFITIVGLIFLLFLLDYGGSTFSQAAPVLMILVPVTITAIIYLVANLILMKGISLRNIALREIIANTQLIYAFTICSILLSKGVALTLTGQIADLDLAQFYLSNSLGSFILVPMNIISLQILSSKSDTHDILRVFKNCTFVCFLILAICFLLWTYFPIIFHSVGIYSREIQVTTLIFSFLTVANGMVIASCIRLSDRLVLRFAVEAISLAGVYLLFFVVGNSISFVSLLNLGSTLLLTKLTINLFLVHRSSTCSRS